MSDSYVMSSCTECRRKMTADKLHYTTEEVVSSRRSGSTGSAYVGKRPSARSGRSSSTFYKKVEKRICAECLEAEQEAAAEAAEHARELERRYRAHQRRKYAVITVLVLIALGLYSLYKPKITTLLPVNKAIQAQVNVPRSPAHFADDPPARGESFQALTVAPTIPEPSSPPPPEPPAPPPEDYYRVTYLANVRSAPNHGVIVGEALAGEELSVVEIQGTWAHVRRGDTIIGWVHRSLLTRSY